jgi:histone arginine demethylase JMJD6
MMTDYEVPCYFRNDLFSLVSEKRRPPYRWFLIGPARSGTGLHIDPLGTSAWNTLIKGTKRWVLFSPGLAKTLVKGDALKKTGEDNEAVTWFLNVLPRIKKEEEKKREGSSLGIIEFLQKPGDTVYIPGMWCRALLGAAGRCWALPLLLATDV